MSNNNWGGKRPGAGRKTSKEKRKIRTFSATDDEWEMIKQKAIAAGKSTSKYIREKIL